MNNHTEIVTMRKSLAARRDMRELMSLASPKRLGEEPQDLTEIKLLMMLRPQLHFFRELKLRT
jgi:hypothetical protein